MAPKILLKGEDIFDFQKRQKSMFNVPERDGPGRGVVGVKHGEDAADELVDIRHLEHEG